MREFRAMTSEELRNIFWEEDKNQGGVIKCQYDEIKNVLFNNDMAWVLRQYHLIKEHAIRETDFYKDVDIEAFPVVNKSILMQHAEECKAKAGFQGPIHITSTSGSTGTPFSVIQDYRKRKRTIADLKVFGELCDYPSHERMLFFRIINDKLNRTSEQEDKENIYYVDSSLLDEQHLEQMLLKILDKQPRIIFSYSSTLVELAKYIEKVKSDKDCFSMKAVLCGGEGVAEEERRRMESVFGCPVYRRYSDMEMGILGQDMGDGGAYILNYGSYFFECLKIDSDQPAEDGEVGRIVVTDLFNYAFPMIRYDTGDLGVMQHYQDKLPRFLEIYGRDRDCVYTPEGKLLSPAKVSTSMWGIEGLRQWQFIQKSIDEYVIRLNGDGNMNSQVIVDKMYSILGANAKIDVQIVDEIPVLSSNKRRAIINQYYS